MITRRANVMFAARFNVTVAARFNATFAACFKDMQRVSRLKQPRTKCKVSPASL
jgi:hypothetical protein